MSLGFDYFRAGLLGALLVFTGMFLQSSPVSAQANTARWGGDYHYVITKDAHQCAHTCNEDGRCRAWVFLKRPRQCRLKYFVPPVFRGVNCCVSGVKGDGLYAKGRGDGKRRRCADYAERAVEQVNHNLRDRCGLRGQQWHTNYNRHFNYCMDNRGRTWRATENARKNQIDRCQRDIQARRDIRCNHLARMAVQQGRTNIDNSCGFKGPYWDPTLNQQTHACKDAGADRDKHTRYDLARFKKRENRLRRCMSRGGGARDSACDSFTKSAISYYQRSLKYRCRLSSDVWNDNYDHQYSWCKSVNPEVRKKRLEIMYYQYRRCKKRRGWKKLFKF